MVDRIEHDINEGEAEFTPAFTPAEQTDPAQLAHTPEDAIAIARAKRANAEATMLKMTPPSPGTATETFVPPTTTPSESLVEAVDRVVPNMPAQPSEQLAAAMGGGETTPRFESAQSARDLEKFVAEKELTPEDEAPLVAYAKVVIEREKAQVAGDWNKERQIREQQKTAFEGLTEKGKPVADAYAARYSKDIRQKEQAAA